jgi:hypothetical protein
MNKNTHVQNSYLYVLKIPRFRTIDLIGVGIVGGYVSRRFFMIPRRRGWSLRGSFPVMAGWWGG